MKIIISLSPRIFDANKFTFILLGYGCCKYDGSLMKTFSTEQFCMNINKLLDLIQHLYQRK